MKLLKTVLFATAIGLTMTGCQTMENMAKTGVTNPLSPTLTKDTKQFREAVTNRPKYAAMAHVRKEIERLYPNAKIITYNTSTGLIQTKAYNIVPSDIPLHTDGTGKFTDAQAALTVIVTPLSNSRSMIAVGYHYVASKNYTLTWKQYKSNGKLEQKAANHYAK